MISRVLKSVFLITFGLILSFFMAEFAVRYLQDRNKPPSKVRQSDELTHHSLRSNTQDIARSDEWEIHYQINSLGFRDKEYSQEKPDNTYRILMVGDSFTEGQGVEAEDTFSKLLEKSLGEKIQGKKIEVINTGTLSYSSLLEFLMLKYRGLELSPDLVILNFDISDVSDDYRYEVELIKDVQGIPEKFQKDPYANINTFEQNKFLPFIPLGVKEFLHKNSRFYMVAANSIKLKKLKLYPEIGEVLIVPGDPPHDRFIITRDNLVNYDDLWNLTKRNLNLINNLLKDNGIKFLLTVYPYGHQVNATEWSEGRKKWSLENKVYDDDRPFKYLEEIANREGFLFHNMLSDFRAEKEHPLYYNIDGHWTKLGHRVVAKSLENYLLNSDLLK